MPEKTYRSTAGKIAYRDCGQCLHLRPIGSTSDPEMQKSIENSKLFKAGVIVLKSKPAPKKKQVVDPDTGEIKDLETPEKAAPKKKAPAKKKG